MHAECVGQGCSTRRSVEGLKLNSCIVQKETGASKTSCQCFQSVLQACPLHALWFLCSVPLSC
jgi:hypothetical protein